ncbi:hypothetical protein ACFX16_007792 [Malus domestica]
MLVKKKVKTSFAVREDLPAFKRHVIDMTFSIGKKNKTARSKLVAHAMSRMANSIADSIAQCRGLIMPPVPKYVPRRPL